MTAWWYRLSWRHSLLVYIDQGKVSPSCFESIAGVCICLLCWGKSIGNHSMSEWIWEIYLDIFNRKVNSVTSVLIRLVSVCLSFSYGSEMLLHNRPHSRNCHQVRDLSRGVLLLKINFHNTILMFRLSCNCWYFFTSDTDSHGLSH